MITGNIENFLIIVLSLVDLYKIVSNIIFYDK